MKTLKQLLFTATIVIGITMTVSAQDKGQKNPPPKPSPPVIKVNPDKIEKPKEDKPKDDKRKKPDSYVFRFRDE